MKYIKLQLSSLLWIGLGIAGLDAQTVKDLEGNVYTTVQIGTQVWMAENLKTTKYNDGTPILHIADSKTWKAGLTTPAYCWYNNDSNSFKNQYGALYTWHVVNTAKLCPAGWHVPADDEWKVLSTFLGGYGFEGGKLKDAGTSQWSSPNTGATNESGFSALPGGYRNSLDGSFGLAGYSGTWWSASGLGGLSAHFWQLQCNTSALLMYYNYTNSGYSVRCIQD